MRVYYQQLIFLSLLVSTECPAQTSTENYIATETMLDANGASSIKSVQYYNGLGYPTVSVATTGGGGQTACSLTAYDALGREESLYLPVPTGRTLDYVSPSSIISGAAGFYDDEYAYSRNHHDALDRVTSTELPGAEWRSADRRNCTSYSANTDNEVLHYEAHVGTNSLVKPKDTSFEYYPAGTLAKVTSTDADGKTAECFTDMLGNTILQRVRMTTGNLDTYFVYDEIGQLRFVLSPTYQKNGKKAISAYEYRYDYRGRVVKKTLPGCEYIQYWYDKADRLVCMQDGMMREQGLYRFTVYDCLGRVAIQGLCSDCDRKESVPDIARYGTASSGFLNTGYEVSGSFVNSLKDPVLEIVNYYDRHDFVSHNRMAAFTNMSVPDGMISQAGQQTGSIVRANDGTSTALIYVHDLRGNVTYMQKKEIGGRIVTNTTGYTFTDNACSSSTVVDLKSGNTLAIDEIMGYNSHNDKLEFCTVFVSHGESPVSATMSYSYDALGRLTTISRPLAVNQTVNYSYDLHGWLKGIDAGKFHEELHYADTSGIPCYNGNISSMVWRNSRNLPLRKYSYRYDEANRLTEACYNQGDYRYDNDFDERLRYDANGNIVHIERWGRKQDGKHGKIDNLNIKYYGNQLEEIEEDAAELLYSGSFDYKGSRGYRYAYNANGSLVCDRSRNIAYISYDFNNNPQAMYFTDGSVTKYIYSATGEKLRTVHLTAVPNITRAMGEHTELTEAQILSADSTDYLFGGRLILKNGIPDMLLFDGGYCKATSVSPTSESFAFYYYNRDHLGNIREVLDANGAVCQYTDYYAFGAPFCMPGTYMGASLQPYKFNGKELDLMHGLNTYDYGARQYYPVVPVWDRMDPLCEKYYGVSPYAYCHNNPIMRIDPDGMDDYYNEDGQYLGTDKKKSDYIYITQKGEYKQLKDGRYVINTNSKIGLAEAKLSAETFSKIFTNCLKQMNVDVNTLVGGKIQVTVWHDHIGGSKITDDYTELANDSENALADTDENHSQGALITAYVYPKGTKERDLISTRTNIQSLLGDHEYHGHYKKNWKHIEKSFDPTYHYQTRTMKSRFMKTTHKFREYVKSVIKENKYGL